jgi:hypothetical protein
MNRKGTGEAAIMACSKLMSQHSHSRTEGKHDDLGIDPGMPGIHITIITANNLGLAIGLVLAFAKSDQYGAWNTGAFQV